MNATSLMSSSPVLAVAVFEFEFKLVVGVTSDGQANCQGVIGAVAATDGKKEV